MSEVVSAKEKRFNKLITIVSVIVPVVVALLFGVKLPNVERLGFLPPIYATVNGITALALCMAVLAILRNNKKLHQLLINICIALSLAFLVMYIAYHMTSESTVYGGTGTMKYVYYFVLISHIILSIVIIPLVLKTYSFGYLGKYDRHRKWAQFTFPLWLYVAVTGVIVYLMISPYYPIA